MLSGNRNFEGRINPDVRMNYLASPPLVVAYALAGTMDIDLTGDPIGVGSDGAPVLLADIWPATVDVQQTIRDTLRSEMFTGAYGAVYDGDDRWNSLDVSTGDRYQWDETSTYVRRPPFFDHVPGSPAALTDILSARCLAKLGDSITTDHISPAGSIAVDSPAGEWLVAHGVSPTEFNSYGSRRGNHEVMIRGTFANVRLRNQLAPGTEGGWTRLLPGGEPMTIHEASDRYRADGVPLVILAGSDYGSGSSRDWAAKGTMLLGVRAVIAESFERIHRSNLIGMGVLPLQFRDGESAETPRAHRHRTLHGVRPRRDRTRRSATRRARRARRIGQRSRRRVQRDTSDRHTERGRLLPPRRNSPIRAAQPRGIGNWSTLRTAHPRSLEGSTFALRPSRVARSR